MVILVRSIRWRRNTPLLGVIKQAFFRSVDLGSTDSSIRVPKPSVAAVACYRYVVYAAEAKPLGVCKYDDFSLLVNMSQTANTVPHNDYRYFATVPGPRTQQ
jgi:hypothetical protein